MLIQLSVKNLVIGITLSFWSVLHYLFGITLLFILGLHYLFSRYKRISLCLKFGLFINIIGITLPRNIFKILKTNSLNPILFLSSLNFFGITLLFLGLHYLFGITLLYILGLHYLFFKITLS